MKIFAVIFQYISFVIAVIGIICYFNNTYFLTIICGFFTLIDSFIQVLWGDQNNFNTEIAFIVIAVVIALIFKLPLLPFIALILCITSVLFELIGWILMFFTIRKQL